MHSVTPAIRRLVEADAEFWRDIRLAMWRDMPELFDTPYEQVASAPLEFFKKELMRDSEATFAAIVGGKALGTASIGISSSPRIAHRGYIWGVFILPESRRIGIGRSLIEAIIAHARAARVEHIHLDVATHSAEAVALYQTLDFQTYGTVPASYRYQGMDYDETQMILKLKDVR